ncbi:MAG: flagellar basal body rod protein FlgB [Labedaea sp.]
MFDDVATSAVRSALTGLAARQRVSANNIANIQTPNFTATQVEFENTLRDAVKSGDSIGNVAPTYTNSPLAPRQDGNNVNLDEETMSSMDTGLRNQLMLRALDEKYGLVSAVVKGGH